MKGNLYFAGYVPLYRSLIAHTIDRRLNNTEALVLVWLIMLADKGTGSYTINQPTLRFYLPGLEKGPAQRTLGQLQAKGYIYREVTPRDQDAYPYWIQGFRPTDGIHKGSQLDLSEVFASKDISKLRYIKVDPATEPAMNLATVPATANSNKKKERKKEKREISPADTSSKGVREMCEQRESKPDDKSETAVIDVSPQCEKGCESLVTTMCAPCESNGKSLVTAVGSTPIQPKFEVREGRYYNPDGSPVHSAALRYYGLPVRKETQQ